MDLLSKLSLNVQPPELWDNQEIAIIIDEGPVLHRGIGTINMECYAVV